MDALLVPRHNCCEAGLQQEASSRSEMQELCEERERFDLGRKPLERERGRENVREKQKTVSEMRRRSTTTVVAIVR